MPDNAPHDDVVLPALLRAARGAYAHAIRARLAAEGFEDMPKNGPYVLGGMVNHGGTAADLIFQLGVSKQAASQLVDALVTNGYLERAEDPDDRRRTNLLVTPRGRAGAAAVQDGVRSIDDALARRLGREGVAALHAGLIALCEIREALEDAAR